jgi:hypothetical protein
MFIHDNKRDDLNQSKKGRNKMTKTLANYTINKTRVYHVSCDHCNVMVINNVICHEHGCPVAYTDVIRECRECGGDFTPENNNQMFCSNQCYSAYNNLDYETEREEN